MQNGTSTPKDFIREFFKRWPRLYYCIALIFGPMYFSGLSAKVFLNRYKQDGKKLNLGSGPKRLSEDVINVDIAAYPGVDVVSSLTELPFETGTVHMVVCDTVLEHVVEPEKAVSEIHRVLATQGVAYVTVPFMYPFHASPHDYTRWTQQGMHQLFRHFEVVEMGVRAGMFSALTVHLCYFLPTFFSFGSDRAYWFLVNISLLIFFPIKFLDIVVARLPHAAHAAAIFYCVLKKRE